MSIRTGSEARADLWEATVGSSASRLLDRHLVEAGSHLSSDVDVVDLGAGSARSLDRLARLGISVASYVGVERDAAMVAAGRERTSRHSAASMLQRRVEDLRPTEPPGPRLVLLTWVLSLVHRPATVMGLARRVAGRDGRVVVAAVTAVADRPRPLDGWIRHRWHARPVDPMVLADGAMRLGVTLGGRAVIATVAGRDPREEPEHVADRLHARHAG